MKTYTDIEQKRIIATNLQNLISRTGKDQKDIAFDLNINPPTFNQWVTGKAIPQVSTLKNVANYFKVPFSYLVNDPDDIEEEINEVLPPDIAIKYSELNANGKLIINAAIESEYDKYMQKIANYNKVLNLDKIKTIEDARAMIGESVAFDGIVSVEEIIHLANEILKINKKKKK